MKRVLRSQVYSSKGEMKTQFCLLGNKKDNESARIISSKSGNVLAKSLGIFYYYEVSKESTEEFEWILKKFLQVELWRRRRDSEVKAEVINKPKSRIRRETFMHKVKRKRLVAAAAVGNIIYFFGIIAFIYFGQKCR